METKKFISTVKGFRTRFGKTPNVELERKQVEGICIFENKYFVCERVSVRSFDGCEIFRIFTLMKRTKY
jgi:hypothetical protein